MSLVFKYGSRAQPPEFTAVDLGTQAVRLGTVQLNMAASMGDVGQSNLAIDDLTGTAGHSSDQIKGLHTMEISENSVAAGNQLILSGFTGKRSYASADSLIVGPSVRITSDLSDCNRVTQYFLLYNRTDVNRPAETVGARLTWLIASTYANFVDSGLVVYPTQLMDANDYTNQAVADMLNDCAQAVGYNWFIYKSDETATNYSLAFFEPNVSTLYTSSLRISNVLADIDSTVSGGVGATQTWGPIGKPTLERDPQNIASTVVMPWSAGTDVEARGATSDVYGFVDVTAADSNVKSSSAAATRVHRLLWQDSTEEDGIKVSLNLPKAHVNDIREGQRMSAKFRQLPGYTSFSWFRVMYRTVSQAALTDEFYTVDLTLSPQEAAQPAGAIVQWAAAYGGAGGVQPFTLPNPITPGNLLVVCEDRWKGNGSDPIPPYTGSGAIGGTNSWNLATAVVTTNAAGDRSHVGMWTKIASGSNNSGPIFSAFTQCVMYEISGTTGAAFVSVGNPGAGSVMDAGSLGTPATGSIGIYIAAQYTGDVGRMTFTPTSPWVVDADQTLIGFGSPRPYWTGHAAGSGAHIEASITSSVVAPWCGVAGIFTP